VSSTPEASFLPGLYVVATPIGNLGDLSPRAASVLRAAVIIAAEDTRTTGVLRRHAGSDAQLLSLTEHNVVARTPALLASAREGVVALVSDAGTPIVSDPGARLVEAAHAAGVTVIAIPGPSALTAALSVAGFEGGDAHFLGFLPRQRGERRARLRSAASTANVLVFFESPNRLADTLVDAARELGNPPTVVCRELTKLHEEVVWGRASDLAARYATARGEVTVVVDVSAFAAGTDERELAAYMAEMQRAGARRSPAAAEAARRFGVAREHAYALWESSSHEPQHDAD
jgi:16S rRNA (cytidine1402-2'-O)-methyltransferase